MKAIFEATGTGYQDDTTFDGYTVVAHPLPNREDRIFGQDANGRNGTCYRAYNIKLAVRTDHRMPPRDGRQLYILMEHGGGRFVYAIPMLYDGGAFADHLVNMSDERLLYATLKIIFEAATRSAQQAADVTSRTYAEAFVEGRLKKSRVKGGTRRITIEPRSLSDAPPLPGIH
jgi:hypothetical protein